MRFRKLLGWSAVLSAVGAAALVVYCAFLFRDLESLMAQTRESHPSIIYSDIYVLKRGTPFENTFLRERLNDLRLSFQESGDDAENRAFQWKARAFDYPEAVLPSDSPLLTGAGQSVTVTVRGGRVDAIDVDGAARDEIAVEPAAVAQLAGASTAIREYLALDDVPSQLLGAIMAIEDQRFLEHRGFDPRSFARAIWINLRNRALAQGGSTITQQLVKNLLGSREKTVFRKAKELVLALLMEARYSKNEIMEKYVNEVYFGQIGSLEVHGVGEAARYFFSKPVARISLAEMAMMAGIIRGPAVYSPYRNPEKAVERRNVVLRKMAELKLIVPQELNSALAEKVSVAPPSVGSNRAPYFVDYVKAQLLDDLKERVTAEDLSNQGLRVFTTLDLSLQRRADKAVADWVRELEKRYKIAAPLRIEGLLAAADPAQGFIRAVVGGRSYAETTFNRVLNMKRQVGSTFKPFAYLAAFLKGADEDGKPYTEAYMVNDEPWTHEWDGRKWSPRNYEKGYRGRITLREAFANSINIPMARIGVDVGLDTVTDVAHRLGIVSDLAAVPSLTLGAVDLNALELLQAYSTLANRGNRVELTAVRAVVDASGRGIAKHVAEPGRVFDPNMVDLLNDLLRVVVTEGTAKALGAMGYSKLAFGKTGTTSFYRDAWFAGFSEGLAAVTWAGFDELKVPEEEDEEGARNFKAPAQLTGAGAALPMWARFFAASKPSKLEETPAPFDSSLVHEKIDRTSGLKAKPTCPAEFVVEAAFLPDTAPSEECPLH